MRREAKGLESSERCMQPEIVSQEWKMEKVEMEDREEGPEGGCNLAGGSDISLQQCQRHKHTNQHPWMTVVFEARSVWEEYSAATGTNTFGPREVSDNIVHSKLYTVYCMLCVCKYTKINGNSCGYVLYVQARLEALSVHISII